MSNYLEMHTKTYLTWNDIENFILWLINKIKIENKSYVGIYGIPKGGNIIATILSYRLNIPLLSAPAKNCLIVDEISATGETLKPYQSRYDIATMHYYYKSLVKPTYFYKEITDEWIIYPWE